MIQYIRIQNFRSVKDIALELGPLNIVFGPNGCGKSNIYNAIHLLTAAAEGRLSGFISEEGGLENMMWSGERSPLDRHPRRLQIACRTDSFDYELQIGFPEKLPYPTQFMLDPIVKEENIWLAGYSRRPSSRVLQRKNQAAFLVDVTGEKSTFTESIYENESVFGQLGEPHRFPEVSRVRETLRRWRFYHEFAIGRHSPLRQPAVGYRSPVLDSDGQNLAAAFQTIVEIGAEEILHEILADAFPGCQFYCENEHSRFALKMRREGIRRPLLAAEMSDGTLRFLCLAVALLSPRPPAFLAINEPENSLHRDMLPALARLIIEASRYRFYHEFAIGRHSPLRQPAVGYRSPVLDSDGQNLAAAFQTIVEIGAEEILHEILADAFPGCQFYCENEHSRFALKMRREGIRRPLLAAEMSDGTLRFLCLAVALLSPRPPAFLAINEPENSLHRDMLPALARLIIEASRYSQIWLTSHSAELAELIAAGAPCQRYALENRGGETRIVE